MCPLRQTGAIWLCFFFFVSAGLVPRAAAQGVSQSAAPQQGASQNYQPQYAPPLTPAEQREKEIQQYDPLYREHSNPLHGYPASDRSAPNQDSQGAGPSVSHEDAAARQAPDRPTPLPGSAGASDQALPANPRDRADTPAAQES